MPSATTARADTADTEECHGFAGALGTLGGWGAISGPTTLTAPEKRHGCAGALRTLGGLGAISGPTTLTTPEKRHGCAGALRTLGGLGAISGPPCQSVGQIGEERRAEIALAEGRDDDHDELARAVGASRDLRGGPHGRARRDADQETFLLGHAPRHRHGGVVLHADDLVVDLRVQDGRHEAGADALDRVRPAL